MELVKRFGLLEDEVGALFADQERMHLRYLLRNAAAADRSPATVRSPSSALEAALARETA